VHSVRGCRRHDGTYPTLHNLHMDHEEDNNNKQDKDYFSSVN